MLACSLLNFFSYTAATIKSLLCIYEMDVVKCVVHIFPTSQPPSVAILGRHHWLQHPIRCKHVTIFQFQYNSYQ